MSESVVYFAKGAGAIKIGVTTRISERLADIQVSLPDDLLLLASVPGGHDLEQHLHETFRHLNVRGEWFRPAPDLVEYVTLIQEHGEDAIPAGFRTRKALERMPHDITTEMVTEAVRVGLRAEFPNSLHLAKTLAFDIGADPRAAENWLSGANAPSATKMLRMMLIYPKVRAAVLTLIDPDLAQATDPIATLRHARQALSDAITQMEALSDGG